MAKALYALKIWLFRKQDAFKLTTKEERGIKAVCKCVIELYVEYWFKTPNAIAAPNTDLKLLKQLNADNSNSSKATLKKLKGHLWYLSEELVALAFFDADVDIQTKKKMVAKLQSPVEENRCVRDLHIIDIDRKCISDFVTKKHS